MEYKILVLILVIVMLFSGCKPADNGYPITDKDYKQGTKGLVFDFIPNGPPDTLFENTNFEIATDLWNKGAYPISNAYVTATVENDYMCILKQGTNDCAGLSDQDKEFIDAITKLKSDRTALLVERDKINQQSYVDADKSAVNNQDLIELNRKLSDIETQIKEQEKKLTIINTDLTKTIGGMQGRSVYYPDGTSNHVDFTVKAKKLDLLSVQHTSPVVLTACYDYMTELSQDVCIDPDITSTAQKVCEVKDIALTDQGAPIAITRIETRVMPDEENVKIDFLIYINNKGDGQVVNKDMLREACSAAKLSSNDWNRVTLSEFGFSNKEYFYKYGGSSNTIECTPNPLRLTGEGDYIRCSIDNSKLSDDLKIKKSTPSFLTQAYIKMDYGYTKSVTKSIIVKSTQ